MSEMAVLVIRVKADQAEEFEREWAKHELPRWHDYNQRGLFIRARIFRSAFGTHEKDGLANYVIAVEMTPEGHHEHDQDPGFKEWDHLADKYQAEGPFVFGGEPLHGVG
jgi:hypothetical protein